MSSSNLPSSLAVDSTRSSFFFLRLMIYIALMALAAQLLMWDAQLDRGQVAFTEFSLVEIFQTILLLLSATLLLYIRSQFHLFRTGTLIMANFLFASLIREQDALLDDHVFDGCWKVLVVLLAVPTLIYTWKKRRRLMKELRRFSTTAAYGLFLSGFLVTYVFSRFYGRSVFWQAVLKNDYIRSVKNAAEEGTELLGYMLLMFAVIELLCLARRFHRRA